MKLATATRSGDTRVVAVACADIRLSRWPEVVWLP